MGPTILFDKSFLQSLSLDESVWFDHFFYSNICPIFYVETLSDLSKEIKNRTAEDEVRIISEKTPQKDGHPNIFHIDLCISELQGNTITMDGRPVIPGGKTIQLDDKIAHVNDLPPEMEAFLRWEDGNFSEVERISAKLWRKSIKSINIESIARFVATLNITLKKCKSLDEAKNFAEFIVNGRDQVIKRLKFFLTLLAIPPEFFGPIYFSWMSKNVPPLKHFAPYTAHVLTIDIFFYIAAYSNLISSQKASNRVDLAYLFYLPFCNIFTSSDNLHKKCTSLFLNDDQLFLWGPDLKIGLKELDEYYDKLPVSEKEKGIYELAPYPPLDDGYLVRRIWDYFLEKRRNKLSPKPPRKKAHDLRTETTTKDMVDHINKLVDTAKELKEDQILEHVENPDEMIITRKTRKKKGKWWLLPKDLEN